MIQVRLFHVPAIHLAYIADQTTYDIDDDDGKKRRTEELAKVAVCIRDRVKKLIEEDKPDESLMYSQRLINDMAEMHADTWIEGVGLHTVEYSTTTKRPTHHTITTSGSKAVTNKRISGDVSGVIGETLFSVVLREHYKMNEYSDYSHLTKPNTLRYPDFGIVDPSDEFKDEMSCQGVFVHYSGFTIPCEVKTFSHFAYKPLDRIRDAADQLVSFWYNKSLVKGVGMICIPILNRSNGSYDLYLVWSY